MGLKLFGPGGIDQKSNHLLRDPRKLRDARNIEYNTHKEYVKRDGSDIDIDFTGDNYSDVVYIKSLGEYFFRDGSDYKRYKSGSKRTIPKFVDPSTSGLSIISGDEYLNTFVFTHTSGQICTATYDGSSIYRSGLPTPATLPIGTGSGYYMLSFFEFIDAQGNTIYGPSTINENVATGSFNITFDTLAKEGFCASFLRASISTTPIVLDSTSRTITYDTISSDIVVGGKVVFRDRGNTIVLSDVVTPSRDMNSDFIILEIESVDVGTKLITFTADSFKTTRVTIALTSGSPVIANIHGGCVLRIMFSNTETTGYTTLQSSLNGVLVDNSSTTQTATISFTSTVYDTLLSDFYDITTSKLRPPRCAHIKVFGDQIVCGNVLGFYDFENKETKYTNNDLVMYSDTSSGDIGFNFSEINRQLIGNTYDGEITGLVRARDSMIVFKDTSIYSLDGVLIPGQYGLRKIETNEIGCLFEKSIISMDGVVLFQGQDGIYQLNGYKAEKVTDQLDPFFETIDPSQTRSVVRNKKDQFLFYTDQGVAVFDYHYKEWFIWDSLTAPKGLIVDNNREVKMFTDTDCIEFISDKNDQGDPINAYIETAWFDLGEPSLLKKTTDLRVFSLNNAGQVLTAQVFHDWDTAKFKSPFTIDMSNTDTKTVLKKLDIQLGQSISLKISNNIVDEDMNISGYELLIDVIQGKDKNVK
jgi:hypothetical protein